MGKVAYSIAEAAETTTTSESIIIEEIRAGRLRVRAIGATKIILHSDLIEWADGLLDLNLPRPASAMRHLSVAT